MLQSIASSNISESGRLLVRCLVFVLFLILLEVLHTRRLCGECFILHLGFFDSLVNRFWTGNVFDGLIAHLRLLDSIPVSASLIFDGRCVYVVFSDVCPLCSPVYILDPSMFFVLEFVVRQGVGFRNGCLATLCLCISWWILDLY